MKSKRVSKGKSQHVIPVGNGWVVKGDGNTKFTIIADNKKDAVVFAREIAKTNGSELIIHGKDGKIAERNSYSGRVLDKEEE